MCRNFRLRKIAASIHTAEFARRRLHPSFGDEYGCGDVFTA